MRDIGKYLEQAGHHTLVCALVDEIPSPGEPWGSTKRAKWIAAAQTIFDLLYTEQGKKTKPEFEPATVEAAEATSIALPPTPPPERKHIDYGSDFLSQPQRHVMEALIQLQKKPGDWIAEPLRAIAQKAGVSANGCNSTVDSLEKKGLIRVDRRGGDGVNRYMILSPARAAA